MTQFPNFKQFTLMEQSESTSSDSTNVLSAEDWTIADKDGNINIPDRLDKLFNKLGMQMRFHTISGKNELQTVVDMTAIADKYSAQQNDELIKAGNKMAEALNATNDYFEGSHKYTSEDIVEMKNKSLSEWEKLNK